MEALLRDKEVAQMLDLKPATMRYWRSTGKGPPYFRLAGKGSPARYRRSDVEVWLESCRREPK